MSLFVSESIGITAIEVERERETKGISSKPRLDSRPIFVLLTPGYTRTGERVTMPSLGPENKPGKGRRLGCQPIPLPAFPLEFRQTLDADKNVVQMLEEVRAARALQAHQAQEHDRRQPEP